MHFLHVIKCILESTAMIVNLRLLKSFLAVSRSGSVTKAADVLHISQPALTRQIQELEEVYGCKLFERSKKGLILTESGYRLQASAQELLLLEERIRREMRSVEEFVGGVVRVGCVESIAAEWLADRLAEWSKRYPLAQFEVYSGDGDDIRAKLDDERLDIGVLVTPVEVAKYDDQPLDCIERWGVAVSRDSPWAGETELAKERLRECPLILPRRHIVIDSLREWLGDTVGELTISGYHNVPTVGLLMVKRGMGALLCIEGAITIRPDDDVVFVPITPVKLAGHRLVRKKNRKLSRAAENFWAMCLQHTRKWVAGHEQNA